MYIFRWMLSLQLLQLYYATAAAFSAFNVENIVHKNVLFNIWDVSGKENSVSSFCAKFYLMISLMWIRC